MGGEERSEIQEFFEGRSVLITGAGGFLGGVLVEHLLRLCPGIVEIFILLREKKGCSPGVRKDMILNKPIFWKVKEDNPTALEKVYVVSGELTDCDLGISPPDLEKLRENVSVVFHSAASVSFRKEFSYMLLNNVVATHNVIKLCRKLPKLEAFVHTSTAYSNSGDKVIKEEVTQMLPVPVKKILEAARNGDEAFLTALVEDYGKKWENYYTFSKSIAELVVADEATHIPRAIVRPSIINHVWKGSLPGYIETGTAFADITYGAITGFMYVVLVDSTKMVDTIPPDVVSNALITAAWSVAKKGADTPLVVNCISSNSAQFTWGELFSVITDKSYRCITPYTFRTPAVIYVANAIWYKLLSFLYHHIPGYVLDLHERITGGKPRLIKSYKILDQSLFEVQHFAKNTFHFKSENFDGLKCIVNKKDKEIFSTDLTGYSFSYIMENLHVNKFCQFKDDDIKLKLKQMAKAERVAMITQIYRFIVKFLFVLFAWYFIQLILRVLM